VGHPPFGTAATLQLSPNASVVGTDVLATGTWYDGSAGFSRERLLVRATGALGLLHVDTSGAAAGRWAGVLSVAADSTYWLAHRLVVFSGSALALAGESITWPAEHTWRLAQSGAPGTATLLVRHTDHVWRSFAVTVVWAPDAGPLILPTFLYAPLKAWAGADNVTLTLQLTEGRAGTVTFPVLDPNYDMVAASDASDTRLVLGRRWMATQAVGWSYEAASNAWQVMLASTSSAALPDAVRNVLVLLGLALAWLYSYWAYSLIAYISPRAMNASNHEPLGWRPLVHTFILLALSAPVHALAAVYAGRGLVLDAELADTLPKLALSHAVATIPLAALLIIVAALLIRHRMHTAVPGPEQRFWWPRFLFASLHAAVAARGFAAAALVAAGVSMVTLVVTTILVLITVVYQGAYLVAAMVTASAAAPARAHAHAFGGVWWLALLAHLGALVMSVVSTALWLLRPMLHLANVLHSPVVLDVSTALILCVAALAVAHVLLRESFAALEEPLAAGEAALDATPMD
jgi:hypothetical protein